MENYRKSRRTVCDLKYPLIGWNIKRKDLNDPQPPGYPAFLVVHHMEHLSPEDYQPFFQRISGMALFGSQVPNREGGIHKIIRLCKADHSPNLTFY
jgi:hypothetical protein